MEYLVSAEPTANFTAVNGGAWSAATRTQGLVATPHFRGSAREGRSRHRADDLAMHLLQTPRVDRFAILFSDSELVALAHRLQRQGRPFTCVGAKTATATFQTPVTKSCSPKERSHEVLSHGSRLPPWSEERAESEASIPGVLVRMNVAHTWIALPISVQGPCRSQAGVRCEGVSAAQPRGAPESISTPRGRRPLSASRRVGMANARGTSMS